MHPIIKYVMDGLKEHNLSPVYEHKKTLNDIALVLYHKNILNSENIDELKTLLQICNIMYNNTDRSLLPIEDGVYDLLLEKYKTYDPNFQVGADLIDFDSFTESNTSNIDEKKPKYMATYIDRPKDIAFIDNIVIHPTEYMDARDFAIDSNSLDTSPISKRKHDTFYEHPELIGTLDKCKFVLNKDAIDKGVFDDPNVKTVERDFFQEHLAKGIICASERFDMILELKYDGVSVEADCSDRVISARSRGDTGIGKASDLTPLLEGYRFPHRSEPYTVGVKFEAIITRDDLPRFNAARGYEYKNCRSAIVGLLSSSDAWKYRDFITLVPLAVQEDIYRKVCNCDRLEEINFLNREFVSKGCPLRYAVVNGTYIENLAWINIFTQNAEYLRYMIPFMYDGIVVSYRDELIRRRLGRYNYINKFSIAVKFSPLKKETVFRGYSYTIGQDGSVTPMVHYDPVEFYGTIHSKSSGHSFARFNELGLHRGDIISVEYVNDVMPYVSRPINDFNLDNEKISPLEIFPTVCPVCGGFIEISASNKSAKCINPLCGGRQLARMVNTCQKLEMDGFGESTISQLGTYHLADLLNIVESPDWKTNLESKGFGPVESMNIKLQVERLITCPLIESKLLGSIGFTGISTKTWELILSKLKYYQLREMLELPDSEQLVRDSLVSIKGIGPSIADTIVREFNYFKSDLDWMYSNAVITPFVYNQGRKIRVSGFRDPELQRRLEELGFSVDMNAGVTKDTCVLLVPDESYSSNKTVKAKSLGVMIVPVQDFMENISKYL